MQVYSTQKDYLIKKLIDGAKAVCELFDNTYRSSQNPLKIAEDVALKYELTGNQKRKLERLVRNLVGARIIVDAAREKFGERKPRYYEGSRPVEFENVGGLYRAVFNEEPPRINFSARPHSFAIGFYFPEHYFTDSACGETGSKPFFIDGVIDINGLSFGINHNILKPRDSDEYFFEATQGVSPKQRVIENHELRHIIDKLIGAQTMYTQELVAELFSWRGNDYLLSDLRNHDVLIATVVAEYEKLQSQNSSQGELAKMQRLIEIRKKRRGALISASELAQQTISKGFDPRVLSYIISMTHIDKLPHRLRLVSDYLERHPVKR